MTRSSVLVAAALLAFLIGIPVGMTLAPRSAAPPITTAPSTSGKTPAPDTANDGRILTTDQEIVLANHIDHAEGKPKNDPDWSGADRALIQRFLKQYPYLAVGFEEPLFQIKIANDDNPSRSVVCTPILATTTDGRPVTAVSYAAFYDQIADQFFFEHVPLVGLRYAGEKAAPYQIDRLNLPPAHPGNSSLIANNDLSGHAD